MILYLSDLVLFCLINLTMFFKQVFKLTVEVFSPCEQRPFTIYREIIFSHYVLYIYDLIIKKL